MKKIIPLIIIALLAAQNLFASSATDSLCCHSRFNLGHTLSDIAFSAGINAGLTEILKNSVSELRPDRSDEQSFPSRHTSYAFTLASIASHELYSYSPFWVTAAQTAANAIAMQRVYAQRHFPSDALAGAALGIASTEAGYALSRLIFNDRQNSCRATAENYSSLDAVTIALLPFSRPKEGFSAGCGIESSLRLSLASDSWYGFSTAFRMRSQPVYLNHVYLAPMNSVALTAGYYIFTPAFNGQWSLEGRASAGFIRNFKRPMHCVPAWSGLLDITATLSRQITKKLSVGATLGCDITNRSHTPCNLLIALTTKAMF